MVSMYPGIKLESALQGEKFGSIKRVSPSSEQIKELWDVVRIDESVELLSHRWKKGDI